MRDTLGARIRCLRKDQGYTQLELARKLCVTSQAVSKWENDVSCPDIYLLFGLSRALGVTIDRLLAPAADNRVAERKTAVR